MSFLRFNRSAWPIFLLVSALPRILGAFFLPNAFGDAYVYIHDIGSLSIKISTGSFRLSDLFGFWLPLYQLISAFLILIVRHGFNSGKLVSGLSGAGLCIFVYFITFELTKSSKASWLIFLLLALNPLHIFYSASAMTDVPQAFFVVGVLYHLLKKNWLVAALFAALAGLTRVESWMFIVLIPRLQLVRERRISALSVLVMTLPPLFWFYISWKTTGNWLACFQQRQQYLDWLLKMNPAIASFSATNILRDGATLLVSTDIAVLAACVIAACFVVREFWKRPSQKLSEEAQLILPPLVTFFAFLSLLLVAYLTHQQPIIFPRYGLILFTLGLPVLAWTFLRVTEKRPTWARRVLVCIIAICSLDASIELAGAAGTINQYRAQRRVADYLRDHFDQNSNAKIFCDEGDVRVLSGIPIDRFATSADVPEAKDDFIESLREKRVTLLIVTQKTGSTPYKLFPNLQYGERIPDYELLTVSHARFLPTHIEIYRRVDSER